MRMHSTPASAHAEEVTLLGIGECIAAVCLYTAIGVYLHTFIYYYVAIALAPLSLLRTDRSSLHAWSSGYTIKLLLTDERNKVGKFILLWFFLAPLIRVITLITDILARPIDAIRSIPDNWVRQALCTDIYHPPEIFPLENVRAANWGGTRLPTFPEFLRNFRKVRLDMIENGISLLWFYPLFLLMFFPYIPSLIYRISFKATAIVYLPLVWASHLTYKSPNPWPHLAERIANGKFESDVRKVSYFILVLFVYKIGLSTGFITQEAAIDKYVSKKFVEILLVNRAWTWWQLMLAGNVILTYILYYIADWALSVNDTISDQKRKVISDLFLFAVFVRSSLSVVSVTYLVGVALFYAFWPNYLFAIGVEGPLSLRCCRS